MSQVIRVLVVDDSAVYRGLWAKLIGEQNDFQLVGVARDGFEAIELTQEERPDVVILDLEMPNLDGTSALPEILAGRNPPRVIIASSTSIKGSEITVRALLLGASDYVTKPNSSPANGVKEVAAELLKKIRQLGKRPETCAIATPQKNFQNSDHCPKAIVIGSSTGGPNALLAVLKGLDERIQIPIFIVQHMPPFFIDALADRISAEVKRPCVLAVDGEVPEENKIYIAPGDRHMVLDSDGERLIIRINKDAPENFCRPAVDPLFRSAANVYGPNLLGIILTGMGEDGLRGAEEIRREGGCIIAQDEASSVVWGMPGAVARAGLATLVLPVQEISTTLNQVLLRGRAS